MAEYRIEFSIQRRAEGEEDFTEIGFGSSCAASSVDLAAGEVESTVQNRMWETGPGQPDPLTVRHA
jgi:hypothetical protein